MARRPRFTRAFLPVHATARGVNRCPLFRSGFDKAKHLKRFALVAEQEGVATRVSMGWRPLQRLQDVHWGEEHAVSALHDLLLYQRVAKRNAFNTLALHRQAGFLPGAPTAVE